MITVSKPESASHRSIEDFRGDFGGIASLMEQSWAENKKPPLLYTKEFLESCFEYPGASYALAPTIYHDDIPKAFVAGFPRRVRYKGRELNIVLITFLTVAVEYKKTGYGIVIWSELVKRARAAGFDGVVSYCVEGEAMNGMILGCCKRMNLPVERVYSVQYLSSMLFPKPASDSNAAVAECIDALVTIGNTIGNRTPLARVWNREEAEWQCKRSGAVVVRHVAESREGMLTGYIMQIADVNRTKCLLVEDVLWGNLEEGERQALVKQLTTKAAADGARLAVLPVLGYAETEPFTTVRFRPSQRILHTYFSVWTDARPPAMETLSSFYLDVF